MKKLLYIIFLVTLCHPELVEGQTKDFSQKHTPNPSQEGNYAEKKFYLIDSLDLTSLNKTDRQLIDSCLTLYHKAKDDTSKINALNSICENMMHENWEKYQFFQYELINKALKTHHSNLIKQRLKKSLASALNNIGMIYNDHGDLPKSLENYHKSLQLQEEIGDQQGIATSLNNIGLIFDHQGDLANALEYYHKSLKISEKIGDKKVIAISLNNIGLIFFNQGNFKNALEYYYKSLRIYKEIGDKKDIASSLNNIGLFFENQGNAKGALGYLLQSLKIREEIGNKKGFAQSLSNIGLIYSRLGDTPKALAYYHKSLQLREELGDKQGVTASLTNIGVIELKQNNISTAKKYGIRSLAIASEIGYPENIKNTAKLLYRIYEKQNKGMQALEMYKLHITMRDSINNEETQKATVQQQAKYEYEKQKTIDDAQHEKQIAIEQEAQAKQKVITYAIAGGLGLVIVFLIFVFNRLQVTKRQKLVIEIQKTEVEQQKKMVEKQKKVVEEKQTEILDSIRYAKRIQDALLTSQTYMERNINRLKKMTND